MGMPRDPNPEREAWLKNIKETDEAKDSGEIYSMTTTKATARTPTPKHYSIVGNVFLDIVYIRSQVFELLDENPLLSPKMLAKLLGLQYKLYRNYLTKLRSEWKHYYRNERGSKCSKLHCFRAKVRLDSVFSQGLRVVALAGGFGWSLSKARNKFLIWNGRLGRVTWFQTGTVLLHVNKPGNLGRAKQLFCDAFRGLILDVSVLVGYSDRVLQKSLHAPYETGQRLPKLTITDFKASHGITIKVGDRSHPNAVEVIAEFPAQIERVIEEILDIKGILTKKSKNVGEP